MQRLFILLVGSFLLLFTHGCKKPGCIGAAGEIQTATRSLASFDELLLADNINLVLIQSPEEKIVIEAPENMMPNITSGIIDKKLTITNLGDCRWARDPKEKINVQLYFTNLKKIVYQGSGTITNIDTLRLNGLQLETDEGAGDIELTVDNGYTGAYLFADDNVSLKLHGRSDVCFTYTGSRGKSDMSDFKVKKMVIEYGGVTDTHVWVTNDLDATIFHTGNIKYKGMPVISRSRYYGSGRLIYSP